MQGQLINLNEAADYRSTIEDSIVRELISFVLGQLIRRDIGGDKPQGEFDVLHLVKTLETAFSHHDLIASLLRGEKNPWF
jgi:hypothetical protein